MGITEKQGREDNMAGQAENKGTEDSRQIPPSYTLIKDTLHS